MKYRIGSRGSDLALWQAHYIQSKLKSLQIDSEIIVIKTQGDVITNLSFDKIEGKGFFTKEIEESLLEGRIDIAVHSHKDLETNISEKLVIAAVSERANPSEILIMNKNAVNPNAVWELQENSIVGTSSARRKSQLLSLRPDIQLKDLRGNVPTRINKLRLGEYDAILLAYAGIQRLDIDLSEFHYVVLDPEEFVPAPSQGVLAVQVRKEDVELCSTLSKINHKDIEEQIKIERTILNKMAGGCQLPLGVYNDGEYIHVSFSEKDIEPSRYYRFRKNEDHDITDLICKKLKTLSLND